MYMYMYMYMYMCICVNRYDYILYYMGYSIQGFGFGVFLFHSCFLGVRFSAWRLIQVAGGNTRTDNYPQSNHHHNHRQPPSTTTPGNPGQHPDHRMLPKEHEPRHAITLLIQTALDRCRAKLGPE